MIFQNFNSKYDFGVDFEPTPPQNRSQNHARDGVQRISEIGDLQAEINTKKK